MVEDNNKVQIMAKYWETVFFEHPETATSNKEWTKTTSNFYWIYGLELYLKNMFHKNGRDIPNSVSKVYFDKNNKL